MVLDPRINVSRDRLADYCKRWRITELALFGSVLRDDFRLDSDVDVLASFAPGSRWTLLDEVRMERELTEIMGRRVDLVSRRAVETSPNWIRRQAILSSAEPIDVAR